MVVVTAASVITDRTADMVDMAAEEVETTLL